MIDMPAGGVGDIPFASMGDLGLDRRKVTQCALSRICGVCGSGLGRPIALLGSRLEADRNAFHFPPAHLSCAESLLDAVRGISGGVLGQEGDVEWRIVTTAGFEYVRPGKEDLDRRPTFQHNSILV